MTDEIVIDKDSTFIPKEPASDPRYIKHVRCEGARFHVLYWSNKGTHCSEKDCIINKEHA